MAAVLRTDTALEAVDLVKTYSAGRKKPPVTALRGLSFAAAQGTVFGLLGPNGAGKSTTVKILSTLSAPDSGSARVAGLDVATRPDRVRQAIGFVAQKPGTDPMGTATENLLLAGRVHGMSRRDATARAGELIDRFGLTDASKRLVSTYSGGMARKLDVALGLMHRPRVLFLDEPTTGLDPQARSELWQEIARMAGDERMTVLLTTHYLDEADHLADRLAIVDHGTVVAAGTPRSSRATCAATRCASSSPSRTAEHERRWDGCRGCARSPWTGARSTAGPMTARGRCRPRWPHSKRRASP